MGEAAPGVPTTPSPRRHLYPETTPEPVVCYRPSWKISGLCEPRHFSLRTDSSGWFISARSRSFRSEFEVAVVEGEKAKVERAFEPFLKNLNLKSLNSGDFERRIEAVETISAIAPL